MASTASASRPSSTGYGALPPVVPTRSTAARRFSSFRLARTTVAPRRESSVAMAKAMPVAPPVMMPTRPSNVFSGSMARRLSPRPYNLRSVRRAAIAVPLMLIVLACGRSEREKPLSEPGERLFDVRGRIEGRDASDNILRLNHERIPGFMEAMTMEFTVRGADVTSLPPDGAAVAAKLHVTDRAYWLTDVKGR